MAISLNDLRKNSRKPPRILIYGPEGIGKNTFAICESSPQSDEQQPGAPRPGVVVIQTEDGLGDIPAVAFPVATCYEDVNESMLALYSEEHDFTTLVIDSLDWLEPLIWDYTCRANSWQKIEDAGYGKGYIAADYIWREFFAGVNSLRDDRGMTIIMTAHQQIIQVDDPELPSYQTTEIKLHKRAAAITKEYTDVILKAGIKTMLTNDPSKKASAKDQPRQLAITTGQRVITTQPRPGATAKNRYHLPKELPLCWSAFEAAMNASYSE